MDVYKNFTFHSNNLVHSLLVDCKAIWEKEFQREHLPACDPEEKENLPIITFYVPPKEDFDPFKKQKLRPKDVTVKDHSIYL